MKDIGKIVGENIRHYRNINGLSQEQLAFKADLNPSYLGLVERGVKSPTLNSLEKIVTALDITFEDIFKTDIDMRAVGDSSIIDKIKAQLHGRSSLDQEFAFEIIKQLFSWKDRE